MGWSPITIAAVCLLGFFLLLIYFGSGPQRFGPNSEVGVGALPSYTVLHRQKKVVGDSWWGMILVPNLSPDEPAWRIEAIAWRIAAKENMDIVTFYSSVEVYEADLRSARENDYSVAANLRAVDKVI
jgi:hypothetical protein